MFEFLRALIPGRKADASPATAKSGPVAKQPSSTASKMAKLPAGKVVADRPAFGQKPKAVLKPPRHKKPRAKH